MNLAIQVGKDIQKNIHFIISKYENCWEIQFIFLYKYNDILSRILIINVYTQ